jgi:hypothetical protein
MARTGSSGVEREAKALMKKLRSDALRRATGGAIAGLVLTFGVVAGASADAYIDENGVPVATSGDTTVTVVNGEPQLLLDDADTNSSELDDLLASAESNDISVGESPAVSVSDASGGEHNIATPTR